MPFAFTPNTGRFHVSGVGSGARSLLLSYTGVAEGKADLRAVRYMGNGTYAHSRWEKWLQRAGLLLSAEQNVMVPRYNLRGRYDFIISHPEKKKLLIELKTIGAKALQYLTMPSDEYMTQWAIYSQEAGVPEGFIVYEERDSVTPYYYPLTLYDGNLSIFDFSGKKIDERLGFIDEIYAKIEFVIWCATTQHFPKEQCAECIKWGCKSPIACADYEKNRPLISFEEWKKQEKRI